MYNILIYIYTLIIFDIIYIYIHIEMFTFQKCGQFTWKSRSPRWEGGLPSRLPEHSVHPRVARIIGRIYELQVFGVLTACLKMLYIYIIHIIHIELVHIIYFIYHIIHTSMLIYSLLYQNPTHNFRQWQKNSIKKGPQGSQVRHTFRDGFEPESWNLTRLFPSPGNSCPEKWGPKTNRSNTKPGFAGCLLY